MKKYLIVKCKQLDDNWECEVDRIPLKIVDDYSSYGLGYEVYEIAEDGNLTRIKQYDESLEVGMALYYWEDGVDELKNKPIIKYKEVNKKRTDITKTLAVILKDEVGFESSVEDIYTDIVNSGTHGEIINDCWTVYGEYFDDVFSCGY